MSGSVLHAFMLTCDRCAETFGAGREYVTSNETRAAAYVAGWTFPPKPKKSGAPGVMSFDVCPACSEAWPS